MLFKALILIAMRILFVFALVLMSDWVVLGQSAEPIFFREKSFDFGEVKENGGAVMHEFQFTNLSRRPLKILSVQPSCGCTTSGWTQDVIEPGKSGSINANFDPKGRPGYFSKTLSVTTDLDGTQIILQIKGNVVNEATSANLSDWPATFGNLRAKYNSINFGKQFINREAKTIAFPLVNSGTKTIRIDKVTAPSYIKVTYPAELVPNQTAKLTVTFNPKLKGQYGFVSESIALETDDEEIPMKVISVYVTIEEDFSHLSAEALTTAPVLALEKSTIELGSLKKDSELESEVIVRNTGKKELVIRYVQSNCSCLSYTLSKMALKEGEDVVLKLKLKTPSRPGPVQKAVTIYSSDPKNPVQRVTIAGLIN